MIVDRGNSYCDWVEVNAPISFYGRVTMFDRFIIHFELLDTLESKKVISRLQVPVHDYKNNEEEIWERLIKGALE